MIYGLITQCQVPPRSKGLAQAEKNQVPRAVFLPLLISLAPAKATPIYHYVRSNTDGSLPEHIVFRPRGLGEIDVFKYVSRGTRSAYVTCRMTPDLKSPQSLRSWMLDKGGRKLMATLDYDVAGGYASVFVKPSGAPAEAVLIPSRSWHIFNMDLASLVLGLGQTKGVPFQVTFVEPNPKGFSPAMVVLGKFTLTPSGVRKRRGVICTQWNVDGASLKGKGGAIWVSRQNGHLVEAVMPIPNHDGYRDFRMVLENKQMMSDPQWQAFVSSTVRG